ncbi:MAG: DUF4367 domain-containing protein [Clostridia bacterium]|nr:DUF4367 domain-containing protein [Clostridia bacterium]
MSKLAEACALSFEEWISTFPETMPKAECSPQHEKWKKKLFDKMRNDRYHRFTSKTIKLMLIAAILCALLMSAFVFPSSRESIVNSFDDFSIFKITKDNNNYVNNEIIVGYLPENFELESSCFVGKNLLNRYENDKGDYFTIVKSSSSINIEYNSENTETTEIVVNGTKYVYCKGDAKVYNLIWIKYDYVYRIEARFNLDELLKIAQSVE